MLPVFANTLTMLFKRFHAPTSWILSTIVPVSILYDAFHRLHARQFHWQDLQGDFCC